MIGSSRNFSVIGSSRNLRLGKSSAAIVNGDMSDEFGPMKSGTQMTRPVPLPLSVRVAPVGLVISDNVIFCPFGSEATISSLSVSPSITV